MVGQARAGSIGGVPGHKRAAPERQAAPRRTRRSAGGAQDRSLRQLVEHMSDGAATLTAGGEVVWANRPLAVILGLSPRQLLGMRVVDAVDATAREAVSRLLVDVDLPRREASLEVRRPDGSTVSIRITAFAVTVGGEAGHGIVVTDLTQQRATEQDLRGSAVELDALVQHRTRQLEQTTQELEAFTYSVSHDLRTPLRAIRAFSRILLEEHLQGLDAEGRRLLGIVVRNTEQMGALIDDLLALSRVGHMELTPRVVGMDRLARQVASELRMLESGRRIDLDIGSLDDVSGEPALLRQVWSNLIGNALKFTRRAPIAHITIRCARDARESRYTVGDNGVGFEPAGAGELFKPFRRLHQVGEFEGTGIGLAIVSRIVTRHGGRVWAEGRPGEGATFGFALPRHGEVRAGLAG